MKKQQLSLVDRIEREALGGEELEIRYQFTVAVNGIATVVPYGRIEQILAVDGVADVYLEERYELDATVQPDTATAGELVGSYSAWADGYTCLLDTSCSASGSTAAPVSITEGSTSVYDTCAALAPAPKDGRRASSMQAARTNARDRFALPFNIAFTSFL